MKLYDSIRRSLVGFASLMVLLVPQLVSAQGFDLQQFNPMPNPSGNLFSTSSADVSPHMGWSATALFNYANNPLVLQDADGERLESLVSGQGNLHLLFSMGLFDLVELGVDVPLVVLHQGSAVPGGGVTPEEGGFGIGDLRFVPKVQLFSTRADDMSNGVALAFLVDLHVPTGNSAMLQGGDFRVGPRLAFDAIIGGPRLAANVGYLYRGEQELGNLTVQDTLSWNLGLEVPVTESLSLTGEAFGRVTPRAESFERYNSPTELLAGGKFQTGQLFFMAGGGAGLVNGYGTPDFRAFAGIGMAPARAKAEPPIEPTPEPVVELECTGENVHTNCDAVPATTCTNKTLRSYQASCTDGECAYPVTETPCAAGTMCGEDAGKPACVPEPDCREDRDCKTPPETSCTDDVLTTYSGQCLDGECRYEATQTDCEEDMECGLEAGVAACVPKTDLVTVELERIEIKETVYFGVNSDTIDQRSFRLLGQVAQVLKDNPQIKLVRIEGHTDSRGRRAHNLDLSQRRAASVRTYLIGQGVDGSRLNAIGLGPDRAVRTNATETGRAANRRVEFHIEKQD